MNWSALFCWLTVMLIVDVKLPAGMNVGKVFTWYVCGCASKLTKCLCVPSLPNAATSLVTLDIAEKPGCSVSLFTSNDRLGSV